MLLYGRTAEQLLAYFGTVLYVIKHRNTKLKIKKCKLFQDRCEFLGMVVASGGTQPTQSQNEAFAKLEQPNTWGDLHVLIGPFGFYTEFLPLYEMEIRPWRCILLKQHQPRTLSKKESIKLMQYLWNQEDQRLL